MLLIWFQWRYQSPDFTDCAKSDADMTGDASLNILDVIQIINVILGNLNQYVSTDNFIDITSDVNGNDLYLTFNSASAAGLELSSIKKYQILK